MQPKLFFDKEAVAGFDELLAKFDHRAFASPYRSTVPLLAMVKDDWSKFQKALASSNLPVKGNLHFEYQVSSPKGTGKPSHTDLMLLSESSAIAVEAKWTEPRYENVGERLARKREPEEEDPREFVDGWIDLLRPHSSKHLRLDDFSNAVYQSVHRAASACSASQAPSLVYLYFRTTAGNSKAKDHYYEDLKHLHGLLGNPSGFRFHLIEMPITPTADFTKIQDLKKGSRETDRVVRATLGGDVLFNFGTPRIRSIGVKHASGS